MKRKSPIKHIVRTHKKKEKVVHAYVRGKGQRLTHLANPTISLKTFDYDNATPEMIAAWAIKKYGDDALYMLEETGEGREVFGDEKTNEAIKLLQRKQDEKDMNGLYGKGNWHFDVNGDVQLDLHKKISIKITRLGHGGSKAYINGLTEQELQIAKQAEKEGISEQFDKLYKAKIAPKLNKSDREDFGESSFYVEDNTLVFDTGD